MLKKQLYLIPLAQTVHTCTRTPSVQTHQSCVGVSMVVDLLVFIHPDLSSSHAVCQSFAPRVRGLFREHMTHMGARVDLQAAPTLPNLGDINNAAATTTTRIWFSLSAMIQSLNTKHSLVVEELGNRKAVLLLKGNIFGSLPLGNCGY